MTADAPYPPVEVHPLPPYDEARQRVAMELTILDPARNYIVVLAEDAMSLLNGPEPCPLADLDNRCVQWGEPT
jgi:hypothetical protein